MQKALVLRRETLTELSGEELSGVVGASTVLTPAIITAVAREVLASLAGTCA